MSLPEALESALASLAGHKLRSVLTILGILFGVAAVIAMLAIGAGAEAQALEIIGRLGLRNVLVRAKELSGEEAAEARRRSLGISPRDAAAIAEAVPGVALAVPRIEIEAYTEVLSAGAKTEAEVYGVSPRHADLFGLEVAEGRFLDPLDERGHAQVCVVGPGARRDLFGFRAAVGEVLKVNDVWLEVVGVLAGEGIGGAAVQGVQIASGERDIYLPASTASRKFDRAPLASPWDEIVVHLAPGTAPREAAALIGNLLRRLHGGADDFEIVVPEGLLEQSRRTQRLFNAVMGSIAGISLLVGGIGIMNIMLATVLERTQEIGIRRAAGATRRDIRNQFLIESFTISLLGGAAGVAAGIATARLVAAAAGWSTIVTAGSVPAATGVAMGVGLASGIYPAARAAALDPIEALRHE